MHGLGETSVLLRFSNHPGLQVPLLLLFLLIHTMTLAANLSVIVLVVVDQHLKTPVYLFLGHLFSLQAFSSSTILPRLLSSFLTGDRPFPSAAASCNSPLSVLSQERTANSWLPRPLMASCRPLHYAALRRARSRPQLAAGPCISGFLATVANTSLLSGMVSCGPTDLHHSFCNFCFLHPLYLLYLHWL